MNIPDPTDRLSDPPLTPDGLSPSDLAAGMADLAAGRVRPLADVFGGRSPLLDPRPGDRVVSGDGRKREVRSRDPDYVWFVDGFSSGGIVAIKSWRDWCRRNDARPAAGEAPE